MRIERGWAVDYASKKFTVELTDEDLLRLLYEREVTDDEAEYIAAHMKTRHAYQILDAEAMAIIHDSMLQAEPRGSDRRQQLAALRQSYVDKRDALLDHYVARPAKPEKEPETAGV